MKSNFKDIINNFTPLLSNAERISKMIGRGIDGIKDPNNGNHFSELTDLSSLNTLRWIKIKMEASDEGRRIISNKPRVNTQTINFQDLKYFNNNTLGYQYYDYMTKNEFTPDKRPVVKFIPDLELAYICQRFKETHDFYHVLLGFGSSVAHEIAVKWFEALHLRLPSSSIAGLIGSLKLTTSEINTFYSKLLPNIILNAERSKFVMSYCYEERLNQDIGNLRNEMNIVPISKM